MMIPRVSKIKSSNNFDGWDYTQDGRFDTPLLKKRDKQLRNKLRRRYEKEMVKREVGAM
jgi:hypothetical protein